MDRDTEEAIRCKGLAEKMMQNNEFSVAREFLLKAKQLCKDLENISQMLAVCDVHCSAEKKFLGNNEMNWYGILQVVETADEVMIKKQFRKFALLLHPDKNKFPGSESAFKLIGEAQTVLSDKTKRYLHDVKRKCAASIPTTLSTHRTTNGSQFGFQNSNRSSFTSTNSRRPEAPKGYGNGGAAFWTSCPHCNIRFQYYMLAINKSINCYACSKPFIAYKVNVHGSPSTFHFGQPVFPKNHGYEAAPKAKGCNAGNSKKEFPQKTKGTSELNPEKVESKRQKRQEKESGKSCETESGVDFAQEVSADKVGKSSGNPAEQARRSGRNRAKVSYKENMGDEECFESVSKKAKVSGFTCLGKEGDNVLVEDATKRSGQPSADSDLKTPVKLKDNGPESTSTKCNEPDIQTEESKGNDSGNSSISAISTSVPSSKSASEPSPMHACPDPEFNNFDGGRDESCFSKGQIWAVYDNLDVMPRFYARIRKVFSSAFKLRITWLEPDPDDKSEIEWVRKGLPTACGKFKLGETENTEDRLMFSHLVCWSKGSQRDTYNISPRKGETWALFRNWDVQWKHDPDANRVYEFEFVEIVADYAEGVGVWVTYLGKLKGFVSLFCRVRKDGLDKFLVPPDELLRFSHSIRSFKMTGKEREGVPKGSLELDPASFPENIKEIEVTEGIIGQVDSVQLNNSGPRSSVKTRPEDGISITKTDVNDFESAPDCITEDEGSSSEDSSIEDVDVPEPEFFDFDKEKATDKFCVGQIWSLYSDDDGLPKYYARISSVTNDPFELSVNWLNPCTLPLNLIDIPWKDKAMPICCGKFKPSRGKPVLYESTYAFSHQLKAVPDTKKNVYIIIPTEGQVWALYKDWSPRLKHSELKSCKYDIVEVLGKTDAGYKVLLLEKVKGLTSVFNGQVKGGSSVTMTISHTELLRFSHHIPAFQLTEEKGGKLRGFWELDPLALPVYFFAD